MKTQTQVLMKKAVAVPGCQDGLDNLNSTIDRTTHLLEQLLSLARLQNEKFPLSRINLSECVEEAVSAIQDKIKEKAQSLSISLAPNILITGHADSLYILIRNLLDNAVKYTPAEGSIMVQLGSDAVLTISDTGPGISDEDKKRVFNRFVRVDKSGQTGSGLGLSIVQWIAEAQDIILSLKDNTPRGLSVELKFKS
jgi:signal transduction histidine kinase